jgi:Tol biopolymer transport system component
VTTFDRFDPFERRITEAIDEIAAARPLDYLDDILRQTARTSQRPRWTFPERWIPMDSALSRPSFGRRLPLRPLIILALLAALAASALALYVGTQKRLPPPLGPAVNGQIVFGQDGDLYAADTLSGTPRLLLSGEGEQSGPGLSPDGQLIAYDNVIKGANRVSVAEIDGSNPRVILEHPFSGGTAQWSYDSRSMVLTTEALGHELWIAPADGSGAREVSLPGLDPYEATWDPTRPGVLLVRFEDTKTKDVDLYYVDVNAAPRILSKLDLIGQNLYGPSWEFSGLAFSPDGATIAFNSVEAEATGEHFWAHLINRDGTNDRVARLPSTVQPLYSQAWSVYSPDGTWIAMESWWSLPGGRQVNQIALVPSDGSGPARPIGPVITGSSLLKSWSPDGTKVLMCAVDLSEIYAIDPLTGASERLPWSDCPNWQRLAP